MFGTDALFLILNIIPVFTQIANTHVHSCPDSCHINQFHTSTHVLESWTELRSSWHFCSEPSSNTPARQMVHVHQKPVSQAEQTSCDKPQTFLTGARILTMCLFPNYLMPESQVYAQIRNIQLPAFEISHFCIQCHSANHQKHPLSV